MEDEDVTADAARAQFREVFRRFLREPERVVRAIAGITGVGKTTIAAEEINKTEGKTVYFVPLHRLAKAIARKQFAGEDVRIFRGMERPAPGEPEHDPKRWMCDNLEQAHLAIAAGISVAESCCKNDDAECAFYHSCGYRRQLRELKEYPPKVLIAPHDYLFHDMPAFGQPRRVIIDEDFWEDGLEGLERQRGINIYDIADPELSPKYLLPARRRLAQGLERQELGGVARACFDGVLGVEQCSQAISQEWGNIRANEQRALRPGMAAEELHSLRVRRLIRQIGQDRKIMQMFEVVRDLLERPAGTVSGRLRIEQHGNIRVVKVYAVKEVVQRFAQASTFIMSATLPSANILRQYYRDVEVLDRIGAPAPHMTVRQVLGAPVTQRKLKGDHNKYALHAYILQRWHQCGRKQTVVIAQQAYDEWLSQGLLPQSIKIEHYNNTRGIDLYKDVRLLICIGRTLPGPEQTELLAGVLSGVEPLQASEEGANGGRWYPSRDYEIGDSGHWLREAPYHPDKMGEAVRYQLCEAEIEQNVGRGRGINRTAANPLAVDVLADVALRGLHVDEVRQWEEGSQLISMLIMEGILLLSAADLCRMQSELWKWKLRTAKRALHELGLRPCPGQNLLENSITEAFGPDIRRLRYQPVGTKQRWRTAYFAPAVLPDPAAWLAAKIGRMQRLELGEKIK
jgi:putative DNA primase/helicase